jgi:hypothetical protein
MKSGKEGQGQIDHFPRTDASGWRVSCLRSLPPGFAMFRLFRQVDLKAVAIWQIKWKLMSGKL